MPKSTPNPRRQALHEHVAHLRDSLRKLLKDPQPERVHDVRSTTRRIQALLQLAQSTPDDKDDKQSRKIKKAVKRFEKAFKPIRRASGELRDLDIHLKLLSTLPAKPHLQPDIDRLAQIVQHSRAKLAANLQNLLHKRRDKLDSALEGLDTIAPANPIHQPAQQARALYLEAANTLNPSDDTQLHDLRKAARNSRYIAESASSNSPSATAQRLHRIHKVTGDWHDLLTLTATARQHLPATTPLLPLLESHLHQAHRASLKLLRNTRPTQRK